MKNIKQRIVYLILGAALLLFALFMLAVNVIIPSHFVSEAKKALLNEAQYQNRTIPYTGSGTLPDDDWDDVEEEHFLTPSIVFLELENGYQPSGWGRETTGWRKSCWPIAAAGTSHLTSAIPSGRVVTT